MWRKNDMKKLLAAILVLMFALIACASAEGTVFKMGIDAEYPPYSYMGTQAFR